MPVGLFTMVAIYIVCWWVVLFAVLPLGMNQRDQELPQDGAQWGAPVQPNLKKKFLTTTIVSSVLWAILFLVLHFKLVQLPPVPPSWQ